MLPLDGELPAPAAALELALIGEPGEFDADPTRSPDPAPEQTGLLPVDEFTGQAALLDLVGAGLARDERLPWLLEREHLSSATPVADLIAEYRGALTAGSEYRELSDYVAYDKGTPGERRTARARLRRLDIRRRTIAALAQRAGVDLLTE
jgi:hypothetical protein